MDVTYPEKEMKGGSQATATVLIVAVQDALDPIVLINEQFDEPDNVKIGNSLEVTVGRHVLKVTVTHVLPSCAGSRRTIKARYYNTDGVGFGQQLPKPWRYDSRQKTDSTVLLTKGERRLK